MDRNELLEQSFAFAIHKESSECVFWIRLLAELGDINGATSDRLLSELTSIRNMLGASIRTAKAKT